MIQFELLLVHTTNNYIPKQKKDVKKVEGAKAEKQFCKKKRYSDSENIKFPDILIDSYTDIPSEKCI